MYHVPTIIRQRAAAKREREESRRFREDAAQDWVRFPDWLLYTHGITDWKEVERYTLYNLFLDYELECLINGMEYEHPKIYGLYNTLMK